MYGYGAHADFYGVAYKWRPSHSYSKLWEQTLAKHIPDAKSSVENAVEGSLSLVFTVSLFLCVKVRAITDTHPYARVQMLAHKQTYTNIDLYLHTQVHTDIHAYPSPLSVFIHIDLHTRS
jgi:hypothetical protein